MESQQNKSIVRQFVEQALNQGDISATSNFFADDVVEQVPFPGQAPGVEGIKGVLRGLRASFPDMHWMIEEQIAEQDKVVTRFEWTGTHRGEFMGVGPTGRSVRVWGMVIDRLQNGKITHTRIITDTLSLMVQLGAVQL